MSDAAVLPVVVAGTLVLDLFPPLMIPENKPFSDLLFGGQVIETGPLMTSTGGVVANTGLVLHKLGVPVFLMGRIADDLLGREIRHIFDQQGVDSRYFTLVQGAASAYSVILAPPATDRIFLNYPGLNGTFTADDVRWDVVQQAGIFHLGYPPLLPALYANRGKPLVALLERAKAAGVTTSLDLCMVGVDSESARQDWPAIFAQAMPFVDILLPGFEETLFLLRRELYNELKQQAAGREVLSVMEPQHLMLLADRLLDMGAGVVGLKVGGKGLYVRTAQAGRLGTFGRARPAEIDNWAGRELWEPGFQPRRYVTAVGAGDAAAAGFLTAFLRGHKIESCMRLACALGAENLEAADATSGVLSWEETVNLITSGWKKTCLNIAHPQWAFDHATGLWTGPRDAVTNG